MLASFFRSFSVARCFLIFFAAFALSMLYGAYFTFLVLPKVYFGTAVIEVAPSEPGASLKPEVTFMLSADFLQPIIDDLKLDKTWAKRGYKGIDVLPPEEALSYMGKVLRIEIKPGTDIISIRVASQVPQEAADIVNAITDQYKALREMGGSHTSPVQILLRAVPAEHPSLPTPIGHLFDLAIAAIKGVFIGIGLAIFVEILFWYGPRTIVARQSDQALQNPSDQY